MLHVLGRGLAFFFPLRFTCYWRTISVYTAIWQGAVRHGIGFLLAVVGRNLHRIDWAKPDQVGTDHQQCSSAAWWQRCCDVAPPPAPTRRKSTVRPHRHTQQGTGFPRVRDRNPDVESTGNVVGGGGGDLDRNNHQKKCHRLTQTPTRALSSSAVRYMPPSDVH